METRFCLRCCHAQLSICIEENQVADCPSKGYEEQVHKENGEEGLRRDGVDGEGDERRGGWGDRRERRDEQRKGKVEGCGSEMAWLVWGVQGLEENKPDAMCAAASFRNCHTRPTLCA